LGIHRAITTIVTNITKHTLRRISPLLTAKPITELLVLDRETPILVPATDKNITRQLGCYDDQSYSDVFDRFVFSQRHRSRVIY